MQASEAGGAPPGEAVTIPSGRYSFAKIVRVVAKHFDLTQEELMAKTRRPSSSHPRRIICYLAMSKTRVSSNWVAQKLPISSSCVRWHAIKVAKLMKRDEVVRREIESIEALVEAGND